jgi:hypothetical protein
MLLLVEPYVPAHDGSRLVRETSYGFGYGRTKSEVQGRFLLARKGAGGLRFRFPPSEQARWDPGFTQRTCSPGIAWADSRDFLLAREAAG